MPWLNKSNTQHNKRERRKYKKVRKKNFTKQEVGIGNNIHHNRPIFLGGRSILGNLSIMNVILHRVLHRGINEQTKGMDCCTKRNISYPKFGRKPSIEEQADKIADMCIRNTEKLR